MSPNSDRHEIVLLPAGVYNEELDNMSKHGDPRAILVVGSDYLRGDENGGIRLSIVHTYYVFYVPAPNTDPPSILRTVFNTVLSEFLKTSATKVSVRSIWHQVNITRVQVDYGLNQPQLQFARTVAERVLEILT